MTSEPAADYGQNVPAVDQAARILYYLAGDTRGQSTLTEVCNAIGIYKSKGRAILNTLRGANLVSRNDQEKTYSLGTGLIVLSRAVLDRTDLSAVVAPYLEQLAVYPGTCAFLALTRDSEFYVVARREGPGGLSVTIRVGYHYPLTWGSMGKAIVAFFPEPEREKVLAEGAFLFYGDPPTTPADLDAVRRELDECRRLGYGIDLGAIQQGFSAVSAPLFGSRWPSRPVGVVTLFGTFSAEEAVAHGERVAAIAHEMRVRLGPLFDGLA